MHLSMYCDRNALSAWDLSCWLHLKIVKHVLRNHCVFQKKVKEDKIEVNPLSHLTLGLIEKNTHVKNLINCNNWAVGLGPGILFTSLDVASWSGIGIRGNILWTASSSNSNCFKYADVELFDWINGLPLLKMVQITMPSENMSLKIVQCDFIWISGAERKINKKASKIHHVNIFPFLFQRKQMKSNKFCLLSYFDLPNSTSP